MDLFVEGCQGLGLALAIGGIGGAVIGARPGEGPLNEVLAVVVALAGAFAFGWSLTQADHPAWPGWPLGAAAGFFSLVVVAAVVDGARRRSPDQRGFASAIAAPILLAAIVLGGLSLAFGPVSLVALSALLYLALARRRRAERKYEGLRVLR